MSQSNIRRKQNRTVLIVGEGADEKAFLDYLKVELNERGDGLSITIKNAKGKGAKGVINWTIRQASNTQYDSVATLFDTDTDWSTVIEKKAKKHKITLLKSDPCFEAMMLRLLDETPKINPKHLKSQFSSFVNGDTSLKENYAHHFGIQVLKDRRHKEQAINDLLSLFNCLPE